MHCHKARSSNSHLSPHWLQYKSTCESRHLGITCDGIAPLKTFLMKLSTLRGKLQLPKLQPKFSDHLRIWFRRIFSSIASKVVTDSDRKHPQTCLNAKLTNLAKPTNFSGLAKSYQPRKEEILFSNFSKSYLSESYLFLPFFQIVFDNSWVMKTRIWSVT